VTLHQSGQSAYRNAVPCVAIQLKHEVLAGERLVAKANAQAKQKHVFVINDTVAILELFRSLLEDEGYRVTTDGFSVELVEMLGRVRDARPDVLVLDFVIMDEGKGWQFLQLLKMDRETKDIPVIACTAAAKLVEELQVHLDTMGVVVVLKPFDIDHLLAELEKLCNSPELDQAPFSKARGS
jgi:CheY-like chemotaxis protein